VCRSLSLWSARLKSQVVLLDYVLYFIIPLSDMHCLIFLFEIYFGDEVRIKRCFQLYAEISIVCVEILAEPDMLI
jgi:hypothetical protein